MAGPDPYAGIATEVQPQADPYAGIASPVQAQQLPPVVYAQPVQYEGHPEDYVWDDRLPDPGPGMAWPKGTIPDPKANSAGNSVAHLPGDPKPYFGRPLYVDPQTQDAVNQLLNTAPAGTKAPNAVQDAAMSAGAGGVRGLGYLLTAPGDLTTLAERGIGMLGDRVMENLPPELGGWSHYHSMLNEHGAEGQKLWDGSDTLWPTTQNFRAAVGKALGPNQELYEPKTEAGKFVNSVAELLPSTAAGGEGIAQRVLPAVFGGTLGQVGEDVTRGTAFEPWARLVGTVVGAGGGGALTQPATVGKMLAQGSRGLTQDKIDLATALMQSGEGIGVPVSSAEAVNQVTGGAFPGLTRLQRVAEGTREGQAIYGPRMAQRPAQLADALRSTVLDPLAPAPSSAAGLGLSAQGGSESALGGVRSSINQAAGPYYARLAGQTLPDEDFAALSAHPSFLAAFDAVKSDPELAVRLPADTPDNDLSRINEVVKQLDAMKEGASVSPFNPGGNNTIAGVRGDVRATADEMASRASPDWEAARQIVSEGRQKILAPLQEGALGQVGRTSDPLAQSAALYPGAPAEGQTADTIAALRLLGEHADGVPEQLTRTHLSNTWNTASRSAVPDQWTGARWYKQALGNPEQKAVTLAGVGEAGGPELADALSRFGDVAQATGYRARQGSSTAFNLEDLGDMAHGGPVGTGIKAVADPFKVPEMVKDAFTRWQVGRNSEALANSFIAGSPEKRAKILSEALKNHPTTAGGWASKLLLYDNPVLPGRGEKKEGASAP